MTSFETVAEAQEYVRHIIDVPVTEHKEAIAESVQFHAFPYGLADGRFTNVYDISYRKGEAIPAIHVHDRLLSVYDFARSHGGSVVSSGGFFFLAGVTSGMPRQLSLNLAIANGELLSLPVLDREAVFCNGHMLFARPVRSLGTLSINGCELSWSGSLTDYETDAKVFGNGNAIITHQRNEATGSVRVLDERSRFTPPIEHDDIVDIGFVARGDGTFEGRDASTTGGVDIFAHDVVVRCHQRYLTKDPEMWVHTIDAVPIDSSMLGALSVGPMLDTPDFNAHSINRDKSLSDKPPFLERPMARTVLYETEDGKIHIRLYDGRPGSDVFPGVTPTEVVEAICAEGNVVWGCFLDPGQTAKLCVRTGDNIESLGNRHYLKWPTEPGENTFGFQRSVGPQRAQLQYNREYETAYR